MAADIFVGNVAVGVVPDARGWNQKLRAELVPSADQVGNEIGRTISKRVVDNMGAAGGEAAGAFDKTFKARLKAALESLPKAKIDADSTEADRKLAALRARLEELSQTDIINSKDALRELAVIDSGLKELSRDADIRVRFNTTEARAQLALLHRDLGKAGSAGGGGFIAKIGGLFGGGAGGGAAALPGAAAPASGAGGLALSNPYVLAGAAAAAIAALPFVAQVAAGAVVSVLGGALAGIGIAGAVMSGKLAKSFTRFKDSAKRDLIAIGASFVPVINGILGLATRVMKAMTPIFTAAVKTIAGPFKIFTDTILKAFLQPAVKTSIQAVATAFGKILTAFAPDIPGIAKALADSITQIATAVAKNPKAFADFLNFMLHIPIYALDVIVALTKVANWIEAHWSKIGPWLTLPFKAAVAFIRIDIGLFRVIIGTALALIQGRWGAAWNNMKGGAAQVWNAIRTLFRQFWAAMDSLAGAWGNRLGHNIAAHFAQIRHNFAQWSGDFLRDTRIAWNDVYGATIGVVIRIAHNVETQFNNLKHWILSFFSSAGTWLFNAGKAIIQGLWNGMMSTWHTVTGWVGGLKNWIVAHKGPLDADLRLLQPAGQAIMAGLRIGLLGGFVKIKDIMSGAAGNLEKWFTAGGRGIFNTIVQRGLIDIGKIPSALIGAAGKIGGFFAKLFGGGGSGVNRWAGLVAKALGMLGLPLSLSGQVLRQMQTESGGNPNAINRTDINAQMGDPSRGLLQTIGSTFSAFHVPGTSSNIYDPLANIAAAINYAMHTYGPSLMRGGMGMGSGHGYDTGGWLPPGVTMAVNNTRYPELVLSQQQLAHQALAGNTYNAHFDGLTGQAIESHVRIAFQAMALAQGNLGRQGRRS